MTRLDHLHVSSINGGLYDTRVAGWHYRAPLRALYCMHYKEIPNVAAFKATLRAGGFAWPGGYPMYFVLEDGGALSFEGARQNLRAILYDMTHGVRGSGSWFVVGCEVNYEDGDLYCEATGEKILSAYGED